MSYPKRGGRHEHRIIAEEKIGRPLRLGEVVHHIDGNKKNNSPDNILVLSSQAEHVRLHFTGVRRPLVTVCKFGHALKPGNVLITWAGRRRCLTCSRRYDNEWKKSKRRSRGLMRPGPKPGTPGAMAISLSNSRRSYENRIACR